MLNAGVPASTVQSSLGHKYIEPMLGYARLLEETASEELKRFAFTFEDRQENVHYHLDLPI